MNYLSFFIFLFSLLSCNPLVYTGTGSTPTEEGEQTRGGIETPVQIAQTPANITLIKKASRPYLNRDAYILRVAVEDGDIPSREIIARVIPSDIPAKGALVLTTGGFGGTFYGGNAHRQATMEYALENGLEVIEVKWGSQSGWGTHTQGMGYAAAVRAYTRLVEWLAANHMANPDLVICHGGSGGAFQIAYGLTDFNLEATADYVILAAGPPTSDLYRAVYGDYNDGARWPRGTLGLGKTDYLMGWENNGDYCSERVANPSPAVIERLKAESIVNDSPHKDYNYGNTKVYFVNTNDITHSDDQGRLFYDRITSEKDWTFLSGETAHNVEGIAAGASRIREILGDIIK